MPTVLQGAAMMGIGVTSFAGQVFMSRSLQLIAASKAANLNILQVMVCDRLLLTLLSRTWSAVPAYLSSFGSSIDSNQLFRKPQLLYGYIFGALIFHDPMTWLKSAGGALIVLGIVEVNRDKEDAKPGDRGQGIEIQEEETERLIADEAQQSPYQVLELTNQQGVDDDRREATPC